MVHVKVDHRHLFNVVFVLRPHRSDANVVERAKAHRMARRRVVAWWPNAAKTVFEPPRENFVDSGARGAGSEHNRIDGILSDAGVRIDLKDFSGPSDDFEYFHRPGDVGSRVEEFELLRGGLRGDAHGKVRERFEQRSLDGKRPQGTFAVEWNLVVLARRVVDQQRAIEAFAIVGRNFFDLRRSWVIGFVSHRIRFCVGVSRMFGGRCRFESVFESC
mmetsp:Transcript_6517/g.9824  ORF Transcript_6517/g.9824 Transcript_6517/m.9824 type:complete len:217 (-) Transcript_6517:28-678(-)